jgi:hypothetical protein
MSRADVRQGRNPNLKMRADDPRVPDLPENRPNPTTTHGERRGTFIPPIPEAMKAFDAPEVELGELVFYYEGRKTLGKDPQAAIILQLGFGGKHKLGVYLPDQPHLKLILEDCRHADDPTPNRRDPEDTEEYGVWCHRPGALTLAERRQLRGMLELFAKEQLDLAGLATAGLPDSTRQPPPGV